MQNYEIIKDSPVYAMSLGSHELFHSNFWAWLMEIYPDSKEEVFDIKFDGDIKREFKHFDICISSKDGIYIIENKFKSIPYEEQLVSYKATAERESGFKGGTLICLEKPNFNFKEVGWECLTYEYILEKMEAFAQKITNEFHKQIVEEYVSVTKTVVDIIADNSKDEKFKLSSTCFAELEELRIADVLRKLNANSFLKKYEKEITEKVGKDNLFIDADYSRKNANLNFFLVKLKNDAEDLHTAVNKNEYDCMIGIQIQGNDYRRICFFTDKSKDPEKVLKDLQNKEWLSEVKLNQKGKKEIFGRKTSMKKAYGSFDGKGYSSIYQYFKLDDSDTFGSVKDNIIEDLKLAKEIFNSL